MFAYFHFMVVETKKWKKNARFPKLGRDRNLDKFVDDIGVTNRSNASRAWNIYRKSMGVVQACFFDAETGTTARDFLEKE